MDHQLDFKVRLSTETGSSLYPWTLTEHHTVSGEKKSSELIPWAWSTYFKPTQLKLHRVIGEGGFNATPSDPSSKFYDRERIRANLVIDTNSGPNSWHRKISFSMLGTNRQIEDISLEVYRLGPGESESCRISGGVARQYEVDFYKETQPDWLCVVIGLKQDHFDRLTAQLESGVAAEFMLHLSHVSGFYAEWSPSTYTNAIKVLGDGCLEGADLLEGVKLPALGDVGQFALILNREVLLKTKPVEIDVDQEEQRKTAEQDATRAAQILQSQETEKRNSLFASLRKPLWVIVAILAAILIFK